MIDTFAESQKVATALVPAADAAGRTGVYASLKQVNKKIVLVCHVNQGNAATVTLTLQQSLGVGGGSAKALTQNARIWVNLDTSAGDTLVRQPDAKAFTTDAALKNKIVVFEIPSTALDINNGFKALTVVTGASNAANITSAIWLANTKFSGVTSPSILTD